MLAIAITNNKKVTIPHQQTKTKQTKIKSNLFENQASM